MENTTYKNYQIEHDQSCYVITDCDGEYFAAWVDKENDWNPLVSAKTSIDRYIDSFN